MSQYDYDVIIAGGGMSGLLTAAAVGYNSKQNARVLVIDRNSELEPGKKTNAGWICGDAASKKSIGFIEKNIQIKYGSPELEHPVKGIWVYSPDHKTKVLFEGEGYILNRKLMPRRQVEDAKKLGVEFRFGITAEKLIAEDGYIRGVAGRDSEGKPFKATSKMVVDSSGSSSVLRKFNPIDSYIEREIDIEDMEATGRSLLEFDQGKEDETYFTPEYCLIHLDQDIAPAGYAWVFPKGTNKVNIGLGVSKPGLDRRNKRLNKSDNLSSLIDQYIKGNPSIKNARLSTNPDDKGNEKGNWQVPVRRQNDCMVCNGFAVIGDAAFMPRPLDAGGMGPAMYAAMILGKVVARAIEANDVSQDGLWAYNSEYMQTHGYQMASFEVLRRYLQTVTNEQINYGMKNFLTQEDIDAITERRHPKFNAVNRLGLIVKAASQMDLARGLRYTADKSEALVDINQDYPTSPKGFPEWRKKLLREIDDTKKRFNLSIAAS